MFLAMHQWRPLLGEGIITRQQAALHPSLLSSCFVPQDVERRKCEAKVVAPSFLIQWLIQADWECLLRDLLGTCPLSKMATTDGGFRYSNGNKHLTFIFILYFHSQLFFYQLPFCIPLNEASRILTFYQLVSIINYGFKIKFWQKIFYLILVLYFVMLL